MNQYEEQIRNLYLGILNNYPEFAEEDDAHLIYDLASPEWEELRSAYNLDNIAGNGTASERARKASALLRAETEARILLRQPRGVQRDEAAHVQL